jgi:OPA family glycerol-3-phosphate transporter-like MFS transporter
VYWLNPPGNPMVDMISLFAIGFLIYGPVMLVGLQALELVPKKAAGTAAGFTGLFGYLGGSVAASALMGYTVDYFGWDGGFILLVAACLLAMAFLAPTLGHKQIASQTREEAIA